MKNAMATQQEIIILEETNNLIENNFDSSERLPSIYYDEHQKLMKHANALLMQMEAALYYIEAEREIKQAEKEGRTDIGKVELWN